MNEKDRRSIAIEDVWVVILYLLTLSLADNFEFILAEAEAVLKEGQGILQSTIVSKNFTFRQYFLLELH